MKKPKKIFSTLLENFITEIIDEKTEFTKIENSVKTNMVWNKIEIKFNLGKTPISFRISRNLYIKLKSIFENFICSSNNLYYLTNSSSFQVSRFILGQGYLLRRLPGTFALGRCSEESSPQPALLEA